MKHTLKLQLQLFFNGIMRIMESKVVSFEQQETTFELIIDFCKEPFFMVDLYLNYDCHRFGSNLFEAICKFLSRVIYHFISLLYSLILIDV